MSRITGLAMFRQMTFRNWNTTPPCVPVRARTRAPSLGYTRAMQSDAETNKAVVRRFNEEFLARGDEAVLAELMHPEFVNRTPIPGVDPGIEGMRQVVKEVLHRALSDVRVEIDDQLADGDRVATRKRILGRHTGALFGAAPTGREVQI